ncbi:probable cytochrome P450 318a1 isoform X2 [Musca domestica]|uniref:Probable cytochrome P450 318a1 n=1 Tax=Musca domestica TaxID=7370 RepID=A0A1I8N7C6_MUSDO|nr:probable cytochrome P450 318a1 isoform X2 [Musca domestica]
MQLYEYLLLLMMLIVFLQRKCWRLVWQVNGWRGIIQQPILWILLICNIDPKNIMSSIHRYGRFMEVPLAIVLFDRILLYMDDPVSIEGVLTSPECLNKSFLHNGFYANKGILHAKDEKWKIRRKQLNPAFSHNLLFNFFSDFNRVGNELSIKMKMELKQNHISFDNLADLVNRAVLEASCLTIMGVSTRFTQNDDKRIAGAYRYLMDLTALKMLKPWYQIDSIFRLLDRQKYDVTMKTGKLVDEFATNIVREKYSEWQKKRQENSDSYENIEQNNEKHIFIEQLFHLADQNKISSQEIMDEAQSMVVVSFETASTCVINALLLLAMYPKYQDKLRQEINEILSLDKSSTNCSEINTTANNEHNTITTVHLQTMPYMDMILKESLRLLTTVPIILRNVDKSFPLKIKNGKYKTKLVEVPKNTIIAGDIFNMHRSADVWGPKSLDFYPEHFAKDSNVESMQSELKRHPYSYIPFLKGIRTCIGSRYSMYLAKVLLIKLIGSLNFCTSTQLHELEFCEGVSLKYRNSKDIFFQVTSTANAQK